MKYFCDECDTMLWALESQKCGICAECRMDDDCDIKDLEDMFDEILEGSE